MMLFGIRSSLFNWKIIKRLNNVNVNLNGILLRRNYNRIGVLGIPYWYGQSKFGTNLAPDFLRSKGLINKLTLIQGRHGVVDFGNLRLEANFDPETLNINQNQNELNLLQLSRKSSKFVQNLIENQFCPLILGGDHSIAIGTINGTKNAMKNLGHDLSVIWIDAHADANPVLESVSGNLHGMPISYLVKQHDDYDYHHSYSKDGSISTTKKQNENDDNYNNDVEINLTSTMKCIDAKNIVFIGLRDVEIQELRVLKQLNIPYFTMRDVDLFGINEIITKAIKLIDPDGQNKFHVSFDVDSMDPILIPSTGTPVFGGLNQRELLLLAEHIYSTGKMVSLDIVEFNPKIDSLNSSRNFADDHHHDVLLDSQARRIIDIILSFFGKSRTGYYHRNQEIGNENY